MRFNCVRCSRDRGVLTPAPMRYDSYGRRVQALCDDCNSDAADAAWDSDFAAYHGSHVPQADAERIALLMKEGRF